MLRRLRPTAIRPTAGGAAIAVAPLILALAACSGTAGSADESAAATPSTPASSAPAAPSAPASSAPATPSAPASSAAAQESPASEPGPVEPAQLEYLASAVVDQITFGAGSLDEQLVTIAMSPVMRQVTSPLGITTRMDEQGPNVVFTMSADGYACSLSVQDKPRKSLSIDCGKEKG